jgi:hypothetical protein
MTRSIQGPLSVALAAGAIAAGCGGDEAGDANGSERSEYIAGSNAICADTEAKAEAAFGRIIGAGRPTPAEAQRFLHEALVPAVRENVARRAVLAAPDGDEDEVEAMIAAGRRAVAGFERLAADRSRAAALFRGAAADPATEFDSRSRAYGIEECSGGN